VKYKWRTTPYRHQVAAVRQALSDIKKTGSFALLMEPRTGKTKVTIDLACILYQQGRVHKVVVVGPVSVLDVWIQEIRQHCSVKFRITVWDKDGRKFLNLPRTRPDVIDFVLVNYEAFQQPGMIVSRVQTPEGVVIKRSKRKGGRFEYRDKIRKWKPDMMVLDESHRIKTPSARKTTTLWSIAWTRENFPLVPIRGLLTGTVLTKKKRVFDIYSQWKFKNRKSKLLRIRDEETGKKRQITLAEFKEEYGVWTQRNGYPQWLRNRPEAIVRLRREMHREAFAITRDECYDLPKAFPDVIHKIPLVESGPYYDQMVEELVAMFPTGEFSWAKIPLVQRLRLQQLTSGIARMEPSTKYPDGRTVGVGREKLRFLEDILVDQFEADEKIVIGARFRPDIARIVALVKKMRVPVYELHGGIKARDRVNNIAQFRRVDGAAVFIAQPAAGSLGIDLSTSSTLLWYSLTDSWVDYTQFTDRVALSERAVRYIYLLAEHTIDEIKYEALKEDGDIARRVTESPDKLLRDLKIRKNLG
jgi:SNF2 family DNA or RNA helicase